MKIRRRLLIYWIVYILCVAIPSISFSQEDLSVVVKYIQSSVVVVLPYDKNGELLNRGNGFFINRDGDVVTNIHVLQGATSAQIKTAYGRAYTITRVLAQDKEGDLIRVSVDIPPRVVHPLTLSASLPDAGEQVVVISSPPGPEQKVSGGIVSGISEVPTFGTTMKITSPFSSEGSCNPVLNMRGEIIGLVTFQISEGQNLNFAIHTKRVEKLVRDNDLTHNEWVEGEPNEWFSSAEGFCNRGIISIAGEDYRNAISCFENAVRKNPRYAAPYFFIGYCNDALERYPEAIEAYRQSVRIDPYFVEAHSNLGADYDRLERYGAAVESYKQVTRIHPKNAEALYKLGRVYCMLGRHTEAVKALNQSILLDPDLIAVYPSLGLAYFNLGRILRQSIPTNRRSLSNLMMPMHTPCWVQPMKNKEIIQKQLRHGRR